MNLNRSLCLAAELAGYHSGNVNGTGLDLNVATYLFGPRLTYRGGGRLTPFARVLVGGGHATGGLYSGISASSGCAAQNSFAMAAGGGLDLSLSPHLALRRLSVDPIPER